MEIVKYETDKGEVSLSIDLVKRYLVSGDPSKVTDEEVVLFISRCKYQKINPFLREAYLIKYSDREPAQLVVGKDFFTKRAVNNPACLGWQAGVVVMHEGQIIERDGSLVVAGERLVGGWAKIYRKDWKEPLKITVSLDEYEKRDKDGNPRGSWVTLAATMIRKVALVQGLREAFPDDFQGLYAAEEFGISTNEIEENSVVIDTTSITSEQQNAQEQRKEQGNEQGKKGINWTWFWGEVKKLGFTSDEARKVAGVTSFSSFTKEELEEVLKKLAEEKKKRLV